jgi:repressor of nif and glnA expression
MNDKRERNRTDILALLRTAHEPVPATELARILTARGNALSDRAVRLYLSELTEEGLLARHGRRGVTITAAGRSELHVARTVERVGFLSARIENMAHAMSFDLATRTGMVVVNLTLLTARQLLPLLEPFCEVFAQGYAMGELLTIVPPGGALKGSSMIVPEDRIGLGTVCSITVNGVLLRHGIPARSLYGGVLELRENSPTRFMELIAYDGTSIDPLEVFIRSGMTNYTGAITSGNGRIGASFREIPEGSRESVINIGEHLQAIGLGSIMQVGFAGQPVMGLPVGEGRCGVAVVGGLNPVSILEENGVRVTSRALSGLADFSQLFHYSELRSRLSAYL